MEVTKSINGIPTIDSTKDLNVKLCDCLIKLHDTVTELQEFEHQFNLLPETERKKFNTHLTNVMTNITGCSSGDGEGMLIDFTCEGKEYGIHYLGFHKIKKDLDCIYCEGNDNHEPSSEIILDR